MRKNIQFRAWFYFRQGWGTYFAFIFAAINTLVVTYYLAIREIPALLIIFPSFINYVLIVSAIGIPLLITIGYIHYKRSSAYASEVDIAIEANPYFYKLPPGYNIEVLFPLYYALTNLLIKLAKDEKLTDSELNQINELQKKIDTLIKGGYVGNPKRKP